MKKTLKHFLPILCMIAAIAVLTLAAAAATETGSCGTGLTYTLISDEPPLYLPKDGPLVSLLSGAYEDVTGKKCDVFSMGGGTYARQMGGAGVAFGASFDEEESNAHQANECINVEQFKLHAQICLEAMYRMFTAD